jgi:hypothetical protein
MGAPYTTVADALYDSMRFDGDGGLPRTAPYLAAAPDARVPGSDLGPFQADWQSM